jgi:hypothetical protein
MMILEFRNVAFCRERKLTEEPGEELMTPPPFGN